MTIAGISKRFLRTIAFILGCLVVLLFAFQLWLAHHAEELMEKLVESQSQGRLALKVKKMKFNLFRGKMELQQAVFYSTDTINAPVAYRFAVDRLGVDLKAVLPVITEKRIMIDSIRLKNPSISVIKLSRAVRDSTQSDSALSIPQEMGRVYHSIQEALKLLEVDRFRIDNGQFSLIDKTHPEDPPVTITRIFFKIDNLMVNQDTAAREKKILFSDNIALQTTHQDITFPDGRHRLSFRKFNIDIERQLVEFDSCTIVASKSDSSRSSFKVFFDRLVMTNIDFDTLYRKEVIKADSVYCINPRFRLDVELAKREGPVQPPKLDELIQQLTGDMQLATVVVENASFDINTLREGRPSSFTSNNNNFELQGLRIRKDAPKPLTVERFAMAIRNFENFLRDSAYAIQFDSILFRDNRISLSNFSYEETKKNKRTNHISMPQFELHGLSWDDLVFQQRLSADQVTLYKPVINYDLSHRQKQKSEDIFKVLEELGTVLRLHNLNIVDGQINLSFRNKAQLKLENTTTFVLGESLVESRHITGIQRSVNVLNFKKGVFISNDLRAELDDVVFTGGVNGLKAGRLLIKQGNQLSIQAKGVTMPAMLYDELPGNVSINGLYWKEADVRVMLADRSARGKKGRSTLLLRDLRGKRTAIHQQKGEQELKVMIDTLSLDEFSLLPGERPQVKNLKAAGQDLLFNAANAQVSAGRFQLNQGLPSSIRDLRFTSSGSDSIDVTIPSLQLTPDLNAIIQGKIKLGELTVDQPVASLRLHKKQERSSGEAKKQPAVEIGRLRILQPRIDFSEENEKGLASFKWEGASDNFIELKNLRSSGEANSPIAAGELALSLDHFTFRSPKGKTFDMGEGSITTTLNDIRLLPNDAGGWDWQGKIAGLAGKNFRFDSLGKKGGTLKIESARLENLSVTSSSLLNLRDLLLRNAAFNLKEVTGSFHSATDLLDWRNAAYNKQTRHFTIDSVSYRPAMTRDEFVKAHTYQTDYLTVKTGLISVAPFHIDRFIRDSIVELGAVELHDVRMTDFRDKRPPREPGIIRSLPVKLLKKIPGRLWIDTVKLVNAQVEYGEFNEKTLKEGRIMVSRLNARITHLHNFHLAPKDSLHVRATAWLEDSIYTRLDLKESYADTLGGFLMTVQMGPADLRVLNPALVPLAGAKIYSGTLDSMRMRVVGREYLAFGEMRMYYHHLKIKLTGKDDEEKKGFFKGILNSLVNTVVRDANEGKPGTVFFKRLRDRSAMNYLVKITISGVGSSVGFKSNKKQAKRYRREILNRNLPPINLD